MVEAEWAAEDSHHTGLTQGGRGLADPVTSFPGVGDLSNSHMAGWGGRMWLRPGDSGRMTELPRAGEREHSMQTPPFPLAFEARANPASRSHALEGSTSPRAYST